MHRVEITFLLSFVLLLTLAALPGTSEAQGRQRICLNSETGSLSVKRRCRSRRNEAVFTRADYLEASNENSTAIDANSTAIDAIPNPSRLLVVAASGGGFSTIAEAISAASDLSPASDNRVGIMLAPGTYTLESQLTVPEFVALKGFSRDTVEVQVANTDSSSIGVVLSGNTELRDLKLTGSQGILLRANEVENILIDNVQATLAITSGGDGVGGTAFSITANSVRIRNTRIQASNTNANAFVSGLQVNNGSHEISDVRVDASGLGFVSALSSNDLSATGGTTTVDNSEFNASGSAQTVTAVQVVNSADLVARNVRATATVTGTASGEAVRCNAGSNCTIENSMLTVSGSTVGVLEIRGSGVGSVHGSRIIADSGQTTALTLSGGTLSIGNSQLSGGPVTDGGTLTCAGVYDESFVFSASTCP